MLYLSFAGLLVGLLVFILLCFKKVNTILAAVVSVSIMLLASLPLLRESGLGFYQMLITGAKEQGFSSYMDGVGGFLKNYLLLFMLSALYGKVMEDSGAVRRLTLSLTKLIKKRKNVKFYATCLLPLFYTILGYCGISGFVMVFAVVALGRELFSECNVPWRFYCYGAVGNMTNGIIAGNLQAQNLKATALFGVSASAGAAMSLVFAAVQLTAAALMIYFDVRRSERRGEGFLPNGAAIMKAQLKEPLPDEKLPSTFCAALPLLVTVGPWAPVCRRALRRWSPWRPWPALPPSFRRCPASPSSPTPSTTCPTYTAACCSSPSSRRWWLTPSPFSPPRASPPSSWTSSPPSARGMPPASPCARKRSPARRGTPAPSTPLH